MTGSADATITASRAERKLQADRQAKDILNARDLGGGFIGVAGAMETSVVAIFVWVFQILEIQSCPQLTLLAMSNQRTLSYTGSRLATYLGFRG
jgi:hypothetical protein